MSTLLDHIARPISSLFLNFKVRVMAKVRLRVSSTEASKQGLHLFMSALELELGLGLAF